MSIINSVSRITLLPSIDTRFDTLRKRKIRFPVRAKSRPNPDHDPDRADEDHRSSHWNIVDIDIDRHTEGGDALKPNNYGKTWLSHSQGDRQPDQVQGLTEA
jgi:hypothetical protein